MTDVHNPKIIKYLETRTDKSVKTIKNNISEIRRDNPRLTLNAAAHVFARANGLSVQSMLTEEDRQSLPSIEVDNTIKVPKQQNGAKRRSDPKFLSFSTDDYFVNRHIEEINRAYTSRCFTAAAILSRKVIENLVIDLLRRKFPSRLKDNKELYYDINQNRYKDFSVVLRNMYDKRKEFQVEEIEKIERLNELCKKFKIDANDKTHSLYHIIENRDELDNLEIVTILELLKSISV